MAFEAKKVSYSGKILEVTVGGGARALTVGGETAYPFHTWEGQMPHPPVLAMEVWDLTPEDWPAACAKPFAGVLGDPAAWAQKCVKEYGAQAIVLQLKSTDPNGEDASPEKASATVGKVLAAIDVPLVVWGSANAAKDAEVLKKIAEDYPEKNLLLGPVGDDNHKAVVPRPGLQALLISSSPIDINLAKQLNILFGNLGVELNKLVIDPTTGGLGYGLEYSYSVMERIRMAALVRRTTSWCCPMINNVGNEVWKSKEAKLEGAESQAAHMGDDASRGGPHGGHRRRHLPHGRLDFLILRHPDSLKLVKGFIAKMLTPRAAARERVKAPTARWRTW